MTLGVLRERPTAAQPGASGAVGSVHGPALVGGRASAATEGRGSLSEDVLIGAGLGVLRPRERWEPCICGGVIAADDDERAIADAVRVHNVSTGHEQVMKQLGWR